MPDLDILLEFFRNPDAQRPYSEAVSQTAHAEQCAALAVADGADDPLVAAALLHDIGHLLLATDRIGATWDHDDHHERLGADLLTRWFGPEVSEPVRWHVHAKRYLCAVDDDYVATLSPASVRSLEHQGGPLTAQEQVAFEAMPHHDAAVRLRRWDDRAKVPDSAVPELASYVDLLRSLVTGDHP